MARAPVLALMALVLAGTVSPALARTPAATDQYSLDWMRMRLAADREKDKTAPREDPVELTCRAYGTGQTPLENWKPLTDFIRNESAKASHRDAATTAFIDRFKLETERKTDYRVTQKHKKEIYIDLLKVMYSDDEAGVNFCYRLYSGWFQGLRIDWSPTENKNKRKKAAQDIYNKLK